ncbi:MAG: hypothetical protein DU430_00625 [Candidatus Tokpelaia sp.]|nr:MAG: hypothetical protein DU430_00625 [Candidatus Tokpelaia sp.]
MSRPAMAEGSIYAGGRPAGYCTIMPPGAAIAVPPANAAATKSRKNRSSCVLGYCCFAKMGAKITQEGT